MPDAPDLQAALEAFVCDNPELLELERRLGGFNLFDALGASRQELRHSNALAWLLDPGESHGFGDLFLRPWLMDVIRRIAPRPVSPVAIDAGVTDVEVRREHRNIDLLIVCQRPRLVVAVENKIDTTEHSDQLSRYAKIVADEFPGHPAALVYLTPAGDAPSEGGWTAYSYADLHAVLSRTLTTNDASLGEDVRVFVEHYLRLIGSRLMNDQELDRLCATIYKTHRAALDVLFERRPDPAAPLLEAVERAADEVDGWWVPHRTNRRIYLEHESWRTLPQTHTSGGRRVLFAFAEAWDGKVKAYLYSKPAGDVPAWQAMVRAIRDHDDLPFDQKTKLGKTSAALQPAAVGRIGDDTEKVVARFAKRLTTWGGYAKTMSELAHAHGFGPPEPASSEEATP